MLTYVQTISLQISDYEKALDFYVNTLGFKKTMDVPMGPDSRWITVAPPGAQTQIVLTKEMGAEQMGRFNGYIFAADDLDATCAALQARGVNFTVPLHDELWGRWAQFADPDGNEFGIHAELPGA